MHDIAAEVAALGRMTTGDLAERYAVTWFTNTDEGGPRCRVGLPAVGLGQRVPASKCQGL